MKRGEKDLSRKLYMYFKNTGDKVVALSIDNPREDLTDLEVKTAMDKIVSLNVLESATGKVVSAYAAKVVEQTTTELEI